MPRLRGICDLGAALFFSVVLLARGAEPAKSIRAAGITEPLHDARLSASVAGTIATNVHHEGDRVRRGDVILELNKKLEQLETARRKLVWESRAELEAAEARVATLKADLDGTRKLFQTTRSVSREEMSKKELEYKMAEAERDRLLNAEARERIEYEMAVEQLRERQIIAPFDGVLTDLYLDIGEACEPRQPVARVVDSAECYFTGNVDASVAGRLKVNQPATLSVECAGGALSRTGTVEFVSPVVDPASGLQKVKIRFDNSDGAVSPGVAGVLVMPAMSP